MTNKGAKSARHSETAKRGFKSKQGPCWERPETLQLGGNGKHE